MEFMDVNKLKPHDKNRYFFDDMDGEPWTAFLESIKTSGIIEPIIVSAKDLTIVSGHQRVRAAKRLGIENVAVELRNYESDDEMLKQLIEVNIRQRGIGNVNPIKFGRCIAELERIYGIKNGGDRKSEPTKLGVKTQKELAEELSMSSEQLRKYKSLTDLIPELQDAVQSGKITATTAMGFVKKLSVEEQEQLAEQIRGKDKVSSQEIKFYKERIKKLSEENNALRNQEPEVIEKEVEVVPDDYEKLKKKAREASAYQADFNRERQKVADEKRKNLELQEQITKLKEQTVLEQNNQDMKASAIMFAMQCRNFIESVGGYVFISEHLMEIPEKEREGYIMSAQAVHDWAQVLLNNIERSANGISRISPES